MAGYSSKPLIDKLGIREGDRVALLRLPKQLESLKVDAAERASVELRLSGRVNAIVYCVTSLEQLHAVMPNLAAHVVPDGMVWVGWAKQSSALHSGVTDNDVRAAGLAAGLVDVKVAALSDDWSGLKFVYRVKDR